MSNVILFDPDSTVVENRVTAYMQSVNTPDYENNPQALINPDLSQVIGTDQKYWMVDSSSVQIMGDSDKTAIDTWMQEGETQEKNFKIISYDSKWRISSETWYAQQDASGNYSGVAEVTSYTYQGNKITGQTTSVFNRCGGVISSEAVSFYTNDHQVIEKYRRG